MIAIIDYGLGNVGSILNMLNFIGIPGMITKDVSEIENASKLILPGVGSFDQAITLLNRSGLRELISHKVMTQLTPILGICLGMQIMTEKSEEGKMPGLGWIKACCQKFQFDSNNNSLKIPHMGWNDIYPASNDLNYFAKIDDEMRFYFAHSYHLINAEKISIATTHYGYNFTVAIKQNNILGVQFHPEKSHMFGIQLFKSFAENH